MRRTKTNTRPYSEYNFSYIIEDLSNKTSRAISVDNPSFNQDGKFSINENVLLAKHDQFKGQTVRITAIRFPHQCLEGKNDIIKIKLPSNAQCFVSLGQIKKLPNHNNHSR